MFETSAETIKNITREHLRNGGLALGQCLTAVGWVGGTVPEMREEEGIVELPMADVAGGYFAVGMALAGRRPIYIVRYQGFQPFNSIAVLNYAAKAKEMWGTPCPVFVRSIAMEGGIGPVASGSHHGMYTRMPGVSVCAPMTPSEYKGAWEFFLSHDDPVYASEHRRAFPIKEEMAPILESNTDITLFPISATRLNAREAARTLMSRGIKTNIIDLFWLKPFNQTSEMSQSLSESTYGGLVIDGDYANGTAKCIAHDMMLSSNKKVYTLGLEERVAGFAPNLDNFAPTSAQIVERVEEILKQ